MIDWVAEPVPVEAVVPLRHEVLRAHAPVEEALFEGDDDPRTVHVAVLHDGVAIGVGSVLPEAFPEYPSDRAWRIRGMAVAPDRRGLGIGSVVLDALVVHARSDEADLVWCHARVPAMTLYAGAGFVSTSDVFESPGLGPHITMVLRV